MLLGPAGEESYDASKEAGSARVPGGKALPLAGGTKVSAVGISSFGRWTRLRIAGAILAMVVWHARESVADDPLGLLFCNGGAGTQTPIGIEPPVPLAPGSCVRTQVDDYTAVGGY
jgi:hypothetical protein